MAPAPVHPLYTGPQPLLYGVSGPDSLLCTHLFNLDLTAQGPSSPTFCVTDCKNLNTLTNFFRFTIMLAMMVYRK